MNEFDKNKIEQEKNGIYEAIIVHITSWYSGGFHYLWGISLETQFAQISVSL